jgi:hypothetical protein
MGDANKGKGLVPLLQLQRPGLQAFAAAFVLLLAWVMFSATNGFKLIMGKPFGSGILDSYALWLNHRLLNGVVCDTLNGGPTISYPFAPLSGQWHHLAYTFDGATLTQILY